MNWAIEATPLTDVRPQGPLRTHRRGCHRLLHQRSVDHTTSVGGGLNSERQRTTIRPSFSRHAASRIPAFP